MQFLSRSPVPEKHLREVAQKTFSSIKRQGTQTACFNNCKTASESIAGLWFQDRDKFLVQLVKNLDFEDKKLAATLSENLTDLVDVQETAVLRLMLRSAILGLTTSGLEAAAFATSRVKSMEGNLEPLVGCLPCGRERDALEHQLAKLILGGNELLKVWAGIQLLEKAMERMPNLEFNPYIKYNRTIAEIYFWDSTRDFAKERSDLGSIANMSAGWLMVALAENLHSIQLWGGNNALEAASKILGRMLSSHLLNGLELAYIIAASHNLALIALRSGNEEKVLEACVEMNKAGSHLEKFGISARHAEATLA
jgi:hypothetical protein